MPFKKIRDSFSSWILFLIREKDDSWPSFMFFWHLYGQDKHYYWKRNPGIVSNSLRRRMRGNDWFVFFALSVTIVFYKSGCYRRVSKEPGIIKNTYVRTIQCLTDEYPYPFSTCKLRAPWSCRDVHGLQWCQNVLLLILHLICALINYQLFTNHSNNLSGLSERNDKIKC